MVTVEEYVTPDGLLRFLMVADPGGDLALGVASIPWAEVKRQAREAADG